MMKEVDDNVYVYQFDTICSNIFENPHNYYYHCLQEFTSQNKIIIDVEGRKYNLHKEGIIDAISHDYFTASFDYKFYYTESTKYVLQKFNQDICEPLINKKFKFSRKDLKKFLKIELSKSKKIYYKTMIPYYKKIIKQKFCMCCYHKSENNSRRGYNTIYENKNYTRTVKDNFIHF